MKNNDTILKEYIRNKVRELLTEAAEDDIEELGTDLETDFNKLDPEYRPNVLGYLVKLRVAAMQQLKDAQEQQIASAHAAAIIHAINNGQNPGGQPVPGDQGKVFQPPANAEVNQPTGIPAIAGPTPGSEVSPRVYPNTVASGAE